MADCLSHLSLVKVKVVFNRARLTLSTMAATSDVWVSVLKNHLPPSVLLTRQGNFLGVVLPCGTFIKYSTQTIVHCATTSLKSNASGDFFSLFSRFTCAILIETLRESRTGRIENLLVDLVASGWWKKNGRSFYRKRFLYWWEGREFYFVVYIRFQTECGFISNLNF